jgi:hypothetical protein
VTPLADHWNWDWNWDWNWIIPLPFVRDPSTQMITSGSPTCSELLRTLSLTAAIWLGVSRQKMSRGAMLTRFSDVHTDSGITKLGAPVSNSRTEPETLLEVRMQHDRTMRIGTLPFTSVNAGNEHRLGSKVHGTKASQPDSRPSIERESVALLEAFCYLSIESRHERWIHTRLGGQFCRCAQQCCSPGYLSDKT